MGEVSWIKFDVNFFDNRKIRKIRRQDDGDQMVIVWIYLLTLAAKCNDGGRVSLSEDTPYTVEDLADDIGYVEEFVGDALDIFKKLNMIVIDDDRMIRIASWEDHQNLDALEQKKEMARERQRRHREKQAQIKAYGEPCVYCGEIADSIDHVVPKSKGGLDIPDNMVPCCSKCNNSKTNSTLVDFLNRKIFFNEHLDFDSIANNPKLNRYVVYDPDIGKFVTCDSHTKICDSHALDKIREDKSRSDKTREEGDGDAGKKPAPSRHRYGTYNRVLLSDDDLTKLKAEFSADWQERIDRLDEYIEIHGDKYKNHLATIRSWARKDKQDEHIKQPAGRPAAQTGAPRREYGIVI